jgi:hypothetical protein
VTSANRCEKIVVREWVDITGEVSVDTVSWVFSVVVSDDVSKILCVEENIVCSPNREDHNCSVIFL